MNKKIVFTGLVILVLIGIAVGVVGVQYSRYVDRTTQLPTNPLPIKVMITDPTQGKQGTAGTSFPVEVYAVGMSPIVSLELWANGKLVGVQAGPAQGLSSWDASFGWVPVAPGDYVLIARAFDAQKQSAASPSVAVNIQPMSKSPGSTEEVTRGKKPEPPQAMPIVNGAEGDENAPPPNRGVWHEQPALPASNDSTAPAQPFQPNPGDFASQVLVGDVPTAPALVASANGCKVQIDIHDLSNNEVGFILYRQLAGAGDWTPIATLSGQSAAQWLKYTAVGIPGAHSYYVVAFNAKGQTSSNLVSVNVAVADCPQRAKNPGVSVGISGLQTSSGADKLYCYRSLDKVHWSRLPAAGFIAKGSNGYDTRALTERFLLQQPDKGMSYYLDCWGWVNNALTPIGKFQQEGISALKPVSFKLQSQGLSADLNIGLATSKPNDVMLNWWIPGSPLTSDMLPPISTYVFQGVQNCEAKLPGKGQNPLENFFYCFFYSPDYTKDNQPYLALSVNDYLCVPGDPEWDLPCEKIPWFKNRIAKYGGTLGYEIMPSVQTDSDTITFFYMDGGRIPISQSLFSVPARYMYQCNDSRWIYSASVKWQVRLVFSGGANDPDFPYQMVFGPAQQVAVPCPPHTKQEALVMDISAETLVLSNVQDGESDPQDVEVYGDLTAKSTYTASPTHAGKLSFTLDDFSNMDCPTEAFSLSLETSGALGCRPFLQNGTYPLKDMYLCNYLNPEDPFVKCVTGDPKSYDTSGYPITVYPFKKNNTHITLSVRDGDAIFLTSALFDYDSASADDAVCLGIITVGPYDIHQWYDLFKDGATKTMVMPDTGSGGCKVKWRITAKHP